MLDQNLPWLEELVQAKRRERIPTALTRNEVRAVLAELHGTPRLMAALLYGSGLRLLECARLRIQDLDLERLELTVRDGNGAKDRITLIPESLRPNLAAQIDRARKQHERPSPMAPAGWSSRTHSPCRPPAAPGPGNGSSQRPAPTSIPKPASAAAITSTKASCNAP